MQILHWAPVYVYNAQHMLSHSPVILRQLQREDDNCVGTDCSNIKAELMRREERLPEQLVDHNGFAICHIL